MRERTSTDARTPLETCHVLDRYGIEVQSHGSVDEVGRDAVVDVTLRRGRSRGDYHLACPPVMTLAAASATLHRVEGRHPLLVVGDHINERSAAAYRDANIQFVDDAGNAHLEFGDVYLDIRGRKRRTRTLRPGDSTFVNLFSARRMQVIFVLLAWPELGLRTIREISAVAGTSVGLTQSTVKALENAGYLSGRGELDRRAELVDLWVAAYRGTLSPKLILQNYAGAIDKEIRQVEAIPILFSGESAVPSLVNPQTITLYTDDLDPRLAVVNRWRADREPNIFVRQKFWSDPDIEHNESPRYAPKSVPPVLVYADLMATGEPRQMEIAATIRERDGI